MGMCDGAARSSPSRSRAPPRSTAPRAAPAAPTTRQFFRSFSASSARAVARWTTCAAPARARARASGAPSGGRSATNHRRRMLTPDTLPELQRALADAKLDGWLLFDFQGTNPIAAGALALEG